MRQSCRLNTSFEHDSPADFLKSQWQTKEKSVKYLIYRWSVAFYFVFSVSVSAITSIGRGEFRFYLIYLTHWNLIFSMLSMVLAALLVTFHHNGRLRVGDEMTRELKWFWFLSTSSNMYAFLVSLIYWSVLYRPDLSVIDLNNIVVHATNCLVPVVDIFIVKYSVRLAHFLYPLFCGFIFLFFSWFYPFLGGKNKRGQDFIYPILNWNEKPVIAAIAAVGVLVAGAIIHCLIVIAQRLRVKIHAKYFATKPEKKDILILTC